MLHVHRDSYASYIGHNAMLSYFAVAENESIGEPADTSVLIATGTYAYMSSGGRVKPADRGAMLAPLPFARSGRMKYKFMQKMIMPCGLPPEKPEDD